MAKHKSNLEKATPANTTGRLLTVREVAIITGLAEITIRKKLMIRALRYVKIGSATRIPESAVQELIEKNTVPELMQ